LATLRGGKKWRVETTHVTVLSALCEFFALK